MINYEKISPSISLKPLFLVIFISFLFDKDCLAFNFSTPVSVLLNLDWLVQERRNSSASAMELRLPCINPSKCKLHAFWWGWNYSNMKNYYQIRFTIFTCYNRSDQYHIRQYCLMWYWSDVMTHTNLWPNLIIIIIIKARRTFRGFQWWSH